MTLNIIEFRVDKHWFVVRDGSVKTERLLTLVPKNPKSVLECTPDTRRTILDLFLTLQHPYIYPVLDVEFVEGATDPETTFITLVLPFNSKGSLKDLIYKVLSTCYNSFEYKLQFSDFNNIIRVVGTMTGVISMGNVVKVYHCHKFKDLVVKS